MIVKVIVVVKVSVIVALVVVNLIQMMKMKIFLQVDFNLKTLMKMK